VKERLISQVSYHDMGLCTHEPTVRSQLKNPTAKEIKYSAHLYISLKKRKNRKLSAPRDPNPS